MPTLREIRERHYISRSALAKKSGVSEATIIRMENKHHKTREDIAKKVITALGELIGEQLIINEIEGITIYNIMKDRKNRRKE